MWSKLCFLSLYLLVTCEAWVPRFLNGRPRGGMVGSPKSSRPLLAGAPPFPDLWLTQKLDHFNDADTTYWQQRYFVNDAYYKEGGPVFLMIGGEGTADPIWMGEGAWIENAKDYNAMCLMLEHRFYGKSHPTPDLSVESLQYLSSEQALEDLAYFIQFAQSKYGLQDNKWITFGGSYPGSLSAWARLKYPHLIHAAVATSAPIFAVLDFDEYYGVVRDSLDTTGPGCNTMIKQATATVDQMLQSSDGRQKLKEMFKLCDDLDISNENDMANFYTTLANNWAGVVQYNKDNRAFEGAKGTNITIDVLCHIMTDESQGEPIERYAAINNMMLSVYSQNCTDFVYKSMIADLRKTDWNSSASEGGRQWTYQTCTEFGFFQSSDLQDQPFGNHFPVDFSVQQCIDIFGSKFNADLIKRGINSTNRHYGGYAMRVNRIVFPNGSIDPWHALGFTKNLGPDDLAIFIKGTAHCANMYPAAPEDLPELTMARTTIHKLLGQWLSA